MTACRPNNERGAALIIGMIMLVLITLMLVTALNLGTTNFRAM
jgi:Tfp pilus assembly protein PilX